MFSRTRTFLRDNLTLGNRLSEWFYGVFMVVIITGVINTGMPPTKEALGFMMLAALGVNISWGIIDGVTSMYQALVNRADYLRIANEFRADRGDPQKRELVARSLQGTIVENLSEEEQAEIVEKIGEGEIVTGRKYPATRADWNVTFAIILIDFVLIFPVTLPYLLMDNVRNAAFVSHTVAIVLMAFDVMLWAKYLGLNTRKAGIMIVVITWLAIYSTWLIGW